MLQYGGTFGAVGLAFTGVDCFAETIRGAQMFCPRRRHRCLHTRSLHAHCALSSRGPEVVPFGSMLCSRLCRVLPDQGCLQQGLAALT